MTKKAKTAMTDTSGAKQVQSVPAVSDVAPVNRTYKSTLFIMLFQDKNNLLELYNAVSGKHYTDPEILEINTLENAIYMTVKNDISFLIDGRLSLYEHQSTYNPNLPLRFLIYIAKLYSRMTRNANLYGTKVIRIPPPEFLIFYNGKEELPERAVLNLSDMYEKEDPLPETSPLWGQPNILKIPHMAGPTVDQRRVVGLRLVNEIRRYMNGESLTMEIDAAAAARMTRK